MAFLVGALFAIAAAATGVLLLRTAPQSGAQRSGESTAAEARTPAEVA